MQLIAERAAILKRISRDKPFDAEEGARYSRLFAARGKHRHSGFAGAHPEAEPWERLSEVLLREAGNREQARTCLACGSAMC